jgi:hypothetical protein
MSAGTIAARIGDVLGGLIARLDRSDRSHAVDSV